MAQFSTARLIMRAEARELVIEDGAVVGVRAVTPEGSIEVRAPLVVAADGRASVLRAASGLLTREFGVAVDVLWFRLPKVGVPPPPTLAYLDRRSMVLTIPRAGYYQAGMLIPKGGFDDIRSAGLPAFRQQIVAAAGFLRDAVAHLESWDQVRLLSVQVDRLERWHRAGLLCIGDAAHAMSPVFGVGVNYAVQDAVATANLLTAALREGAVSESDLERVQRRRLPPVRRMQPIQLRVHARIARAGSGLGLPNPLPRRWRLLLWIALPLVQRIAARLVGRGFRPEHVASRSPSPA
jgi:2-polyprenyl-6-methoxyphenol hydroxylase-like FAD-dependent oxidoreductase